MEKEASLRIDEDLCAQILHIGSFDDEPGSVAKIYEFIAANGYTKDFSEQRAHHKPRKPTHKSTIR